MRLCVEFGSRCQQLRLHCLRRCAYVLCCEPLRCSPSNYTLHTVLFTACPSVRCLCQCRHTRTHNTRSHCAERSPRLATPHRNARELLTRYTGTAHSAPVAQCTCATCCVALIVHMRSDDGDDSSFTCAHVLQALWRWLLCTCTQYCVSRASRCVAARRLLVPVFDSRALEAKLRSESSLQKRACAPFMAFGVAPLSLSLSSALCLCCHSRASFIQRGALALIN